MKWLMRMLDKAKKERHGFTLIELMIVLIIVAILAVAAVPTYTYFVKRAYESEASASLGAIKTAQIVYKAEHDAFTGDWVALGWTTKDVANNKWFMDDCFYISTVDAPAGAGFIAYCDGTTPPVDDISVYLTDRSDIEKNTTGVPGTADVLTSSP